MLDLGQQRIAEDMGGDSYNLPGYFGKERWDYYRLNSHGHNLLLFANTSQSQGASANIVHFNMTAGQTTPPPSEELPAGNVTVDGWAIVDLTAAYAQSGGVTSARRGFVSLSGTACILIVDELLYSADARPANVTWQLHTRADATVSAGNTSVTLTRGNTTAILALVPPTTVCPGFAGWSLLSLSTVLPDPPYDSAAGYYRLDGVITDPAAPLGAANRSPDVVSASPAALSVAAGGASLAAGCTNLTVALGDPATVAKFLDGTHRVRPLDDWTQAGPLR